MRPPLASRLFLGLAVTLVAVWVLSRVAGWTSDVQAISGLVGEPSAAVRGAVAVSAWLGVVLVAPSLVLAAVVRWALARWLG